MWNCVARSRATNVTVILVCALSIKWVASLFEDVAVTFSRVITRRGNTIYTQNLLKLDGLLESPLMVTGSPDSKSVMRSEQVFS